MLGENQIVRLIYAAVNFNDVHSVFTKKIMYVWISVPLNSYLPIRFCINKIFKYLVEVRGEINPLIQLENRLMYFSS